MIPLIIGAVFIIILFIVLYLIFSRKTASKSSPATAPPAVSVPYDSNPYMRYDPYGYQYQYRHIPDNYNLEQIQNMYLRQAILERQLEEAKLRQTPDVWTIQQELDKLIATQPPVIAPPVTPPPVTPPITPSPVTPPVMPPIIPPSVIPPTTPPITPPPVTPPVTLPPIMPPPTTPPPVTLPPITPPPVIPPPVTTPPITPPPSQNIKPFAGMNEWVTEHNRIRADVGTKPVTWNESLAQGAINYANQCSWGHSSPANRMEGSTLLGENLWMGTYTAFPDSQSIKSWENEKKDYQYPDSLNTHKGNSVIGHYTQIINKNVKEIGCGCVKCDNMTTPSGNKKNMKMCVCRYNPIQMGSEVPY